MRTIEGVLEEALARIAGLTPARVERYADDLAEWRNVQKKSKRDVK